MYLVGIGLLSNVDYYMLLNTFPYISISQPTFVIGSGKGFRVFFVVAAFRSLFLLNIKHCTIVITYSLENFS